MNQYHNIIIKYISPYLLFLKIGSSTVSMYCPDITDVPAINIQSSNIQYFSCTRKSNLTTLFCKDIVCAIYVMLVHVQNEIQWYSSIHKYFLTYIIYQYTHLPRPQDIESSTIDKNILPAIYLLFRMSRNDQCFYMQRTIGYTAAWSNGELLSSNCKD